MKISISLPAGDVEFVDEYAATHGYSSRSAVVQKAVRLLRASILGDAYSAAWEEWAGTDDPSLWDETVGDGIGGTDAAG